MFGIYIALVHIIEDCYFPPTTEQMGLLIFYSSHCCLPVLLDSIAGLVAESRDFSFPPVPVESEQLRNLWQSHKSWTYPRCLGLDTNWRLHIRPRLFSWQLKCDFEGYK